MPRATRLEARLNVPPAWLLFVLLVAAMACGDARSAPSSEAEVQAADDEARSGFRSPALLTEIDRLLRRAAEEREAAKKLPSEKRYVIPPIWRETQEDREKAVRRLLDSALEIVTDAPILKLQLELNRRREEIAKIRARMAELRERRISAPDEGFMPGLLSETRASIDDALADLEDRIASHEKAIATLREEIARKIRASGLDLSDEQISLLLDGVLGDNLLRLVSVFEVARVVDGRLGTLLSQTDEDLTAARRYFGMHAALFALLVHAQDMLIEKIDLVYLPRLDAILTSIRSAGTTTEGLLKESNRPDQRRILEANRRSQQSAEKVALFYRDYLSTQRKLLAEARERTLHDLAIADNTYETVEASFQLRALMNEARTSFEALENLKMPGFEQIFENKELKREFENLTRRLAPAS